MLKNVLLTQNVAGIGEAIAPALAKEFVSDFANECPKDPTSYTIGRSIIDQILAQPGCVGIKFFNAINEIGEKTLVYVGIDADEQIISTVTSVTINGKICAKPAIVADRVKTSVGESDLNEYAWGMPI